MALGCPLLAVPAASEHRRLVELGCLPSREIFNRRKDFQRIKVEVKRQKTTVHILLERNDSNSNLPHMHPYHQGMVRSSINNLPSGTSTPEEPGTTTPKGENQFTPAVRQFSAPKAFRDE